MTCNCIGGNPCPCKRGLILGRIEFGPNYWAAAQAPQTLTFGIYDCQRCKKRYTVNDQWAQCTPDFCHDCYTYLKAQFALVPVDKDGKDVAQ